MTRSRNILSYTDDLSTNVFPWASTVERLSPKRSTHQVCGQGVCKEHMAQFLDIYLGIKTNTSKYKSFQGNKAKSPDQSPKRLPVHPLKP